MGLANCHIHLPPNFSAFRSIEDAVSCARAEGVETLGASNYYDHTVYREFGQTCKEAGVEPMFGIEIVCRLDFDGRVNDPANPGKTYLCGKGLRRWEAPSPRAQTLLERIRSGDEARMRTMVERLNACFAPVSLRYDGIVSEVAERAGVDRSQVTLQERHLAEAYEKAIGAKAPEFGLIGDDGVSIQGAIRSQFMKSGKPAFVEEGYVDFEEARELILELGGIVAYPIVADGMRPRSEFESTPEGLVSRLRGLDVSFVEFIPNRNSPEALAEYACALDAAGFGVSAGTEHNTSDRIPVTPRCADGSPIPEDVAAIFERGARAILDWQGAGVAHA